MSVWIVWAFVGWGLSSAAMMHFWLPDPPPPDVRSYITGSIAGIVGALVGLAISGASPMTGHAALPIAGTAAFLTLSQVFLKRAR